MTSRHYRLPSLNALATFEASARHGSLKRAAGELNVTPGAVSRQIKALEEELGVALFDRVHSGLTLTASGRALRQVLRDAFTRTAQIVEAIRTEGSQRQVTVACTHGFATRWLMPRMNNFWRDHPDICVNHLISDNARDDRRAEVDLRIRYGFGAWPDEEALELFDESLYPVVSPGFAASHASATARDLPKLPLLHVDWVDPEWTDWDDLLRRGEITHSALTGRRFSNFDVALQACRGGQGVAIGWHRLVEGLIAEGELVRFTALMVPAPGAYYLTWNANLVLTEPIVEFRDWLQQAAMSAARPLRDPE